jgi:hypothetical protein
MTLEQAKNLKKGDIVIGPNFGFEYSVLSVDYWKIGNGAERLVVKLVGAGRTRITEKNYDEWKVKE